PQRKPRKTTNDNSGKEKPDQPTTRPPHAGFGLDMEGHVFDLPLSEGPHLLICGQTGSGKSVYMNAILVSVMAHATPYEVKMTWIDPKKVEATAYVGLPYCPIDPVTDMNDAYGLIQFY